MKLFSLNTVALAFVILGVTGMIVPTGAVSGLGTDDPDKVWDEPAIALEPTDGPNGEYATIGPDGNLSVDLSTINANAVTTVDNVFTITNTEKNSRRVWVTHDANATVEFSLTNGRSFDDADNPVVLPPGKTRTVSIVIDTRGRGANETLMSELTLHAERVTSTAAAPPSTGTPTRNETPTETPTTETPEDTVEETVEVEADTDAGSEEVPAETREMDVSELDAENRSREPKAVIDHSHSDSVEVGEECPCGEDPKLRALGVDTLTEVGETVSLSGTRSLIGQADGVDSRRRIVKLVDITVPEDREDQPATVRITVAREKFGETDPRGATIARKTRGGWQLLDTRVVDSTDRTVTLATRTPGFSVFAVFAENEVEYTWTLPDGEEVTAKQVRKRFDEPGIYNLTLTVTDSFGRSDSAPYRVLVNDRPEVEIERPENVTAGEPVTLRANVTNEVGNATVTWTFSDGTTAVGTEVEHAFDRGEHAVRVTVEDEFGANGTDEASIAVGPPGAGKASIDVIEFTLGFQGRIVLVSAVAILALVVFRWLAARRLGGRTER